MLAYNYLEQVFSSSTHGNLFRTEIFHENSFVNSQKQNCWGRRWAGSAGPALHQLPARPPLWGPAVTPGFGGEVVRVHLESKSTHQHDGVLVP